MAVRLGLGARAVGPRLRLVELAEVGQRERQPRAGGHVGDDGGGRRLAREVARHRLGIVLQRAHRQAALPLRVVGVAHVAARHRDQHPIAQPLGDRQAPLAVRERLGRLAAQVVVVDEVRVGARLPGLVADLLGHAGGVFRQRADLLEPAELQEGRAHVEPHVDGLHERVAGLRHVPQRAQRLLEERQRLAVGRPRHRLAGRLAQVADRLEPQLGAQRVVGEALDVLGPPVRVERLQRVHDASVQVAALLLEQTRVDDVVGEGMSERVGEVRIEARRVEELRLLQLGQVAEELVGRHPGHRLQQRERQVLADDGARLEERLPLVGQPVDARGQHRLDAVGDLDAGEWLGEAIGAAVADEHLVFDQRAHGFLDEERVAAGALDQHARQRLQLGCPPQELLHQRLGAAGSQRGEPDLAGVGALAPRRPVIGAVAGQQEHARRRDLVHERVHQRRGLGVGRVEVLHDEQHRLPLGLAQHDAGDGGEDAAAALDRLQPLPLRVIGGEVAEREDGRHRPVQARVELEQPGGDLGADLRAVVAGLHLEVAAQHRRDRRVGRRLGVGHRGRLQQQEGLRAARAGELPDQTRLAHAGLAGHADGAARAGRRLLEQAVQAAQLLLATEEAGERAAAGLHARGGGGARELEDLDRLLHALDRHRPVPLDLDIAVGQPAGGVGDQNGARPRELLHPGGQVGRLADGAVVHVEVAADRADDDVARVEPHADLHVHALAAAQLLGVAADRAAHAQRRVARAHRVVLVGDRRAEQRHDAVAHHLVDGALVAVDRLHHALEHAVEQHAGVLGIAVGEELERALEVGEEDGHLLALAGQRRAGGQDLAGEVARRVGVGGGEARVGGSAGLGRAAERGAALLAEFVAGRIRRTARRAGGLQPAAALTAELRLGGVLVMAPRALHSR
jgi:hypothetical protein